MKVETLEYIHNLICERMHQIEREYKMYSNADSLYGEEKKSLKKYIMKLIICGIFIKQNIQKDMF